MTLPYFEGDATVKMTEVIFANVYCHVGQLTHACFVTNHIVNKACGLWPENLGQYGIYRPMSTQAWTINRLSRALCQRRELFSKRSKGESIKRATMEVQQSSMMQRTYMQCPYSQGRRQRGSGGGGGLSPSEAQPPPFQPPMKCHFIQGSVESLHFEFLSIPSLSPLTAPHFEKSGYTPSYSFNRCHLLVCPWFRQWKYSWLPNKT